MSQNERKMESDEKTRWNQRHREANPASLEPEPFLVSAWDQFLRDRRPGHALDVAGGTGRNALWLMRRGWRVKLIDISEAAIALAEEQARTISSPLTETEPRGSLTTEVADLSLVQNLGRELYDLIVVFYYLQRDLFPALAAALKVNGILIYKTFTAEQQHRPRGPRNPEYLLRPDELRQAFHDLRILHYRESVVGNATAELVAEK